MTDRDYAIKSMKEITFQMASHAQDYLEVTMERHYTDIKELMTSYQKLILENQIVLEELDMECQEKINEDMAYALSYLSIYNNQLNVPKMHREMNNLMIIYGLSDMIYRGMTLVKFYAPNGVMLSEILHSCFCSHYNKTDVEVQQELGVGRTSFYKLGKIQLLKFFKLYHSYSFCQKIIIHISKYRLKDRNKYYIICKINTKIRREKYKIDKQKCIDDNLAKGIRANRVLIEGEKWNKLKKGFCMVF